MACATFNLTGENRILAGSDYGIGLTLRDGTGTAIDLTGATIASQIRKTQASANVLAAFEVALTNPTEGVVALSLPVSVTSDLPTTPAETFWKYDILLTLNGTKIRILEGDVEVDGAVTR